MGSKILPDLIRFPQTQRIRDEHLSWNGTGSYIDAMYRILVHQQWTDLPRHMIAGMTASVFRLVVDRRLTTESISAYNWMAENFVAADFIGVTTGQHGDFRSSRPSRSIRSKPCWISWLPLIGGRRYSVA